MIPGDLDLVDSGDIRLFVAVPLPDTVIAYVLSIQKVIAARSGRAVRWAGPETLHLTLEFLGDVPRWVAADLPEAIAAGLVGRRPSVLTTAAVGAFPKWGNPRVIWLGVDGDVRGLEAVRHSVVTALRAYGFGADPRPFRPHLTLGRVRNGADAEVIAKLSAFGPSYRPEPMEFVADRVILYRSVLSPTGPTHFEIAGWNLPSAS